MTAERRKEGGGRGADGGGTRRPVSAATAARLAAEQVMDLTGREPQGVTSLDRTDQGWRVGVEVVETHRIPDSTDILAVYRVDLDEDGELLSYRRDERYYRGRADKE
ncbi:gas vesicle protein GvpO [Actinacidiphila acididurans]|uniref:Gas vesicle protein n=1 Tax=Actinacidiphila acididurans TaxID=2784346 RepID=A0ABS2TWD4_9ACTN|nr:gas vesicle protein [Actinacidiphila acididurans]MBM9506273.1 gas vesicle protein [Actinacidiphila acididurans]